MVSEWEPRYDPGSKDSVIVNKRKQRFLKEMQIMRFHLFKRLHQK